MEMNSTDIPIGEYRLLYKTTWNISDKLVNEVINSVKHVEVEQALIIRTNDFNNQLGELLSEINHKITELKKPLPTMWHLPVFDQKAFVERPEFSQKILQKFSSPDSSVLCYGLPGAGKTQLALHYAHCTSKPYTVRAWFDASSKETLMRDYREFYSDYVQLSVNGKSIASSLFKNI
jgi:hypothetical protein